MASPSKSVTPVMARRRLHLHRQMGRTPTHCGEMHSGDEDIWLDEETWSLRSRCDFDSEIDDLSIAKKVFMTQSDVYLIPKVQPSAEGRLELDVGAAEKPITATHAFEDPAKRGDLQYLRITLVEGVSDDRLELLHHDFKDKTKAHKFRGKTQWFAKFVSRRCVAFVGVTESEVKKGGVKIQEFINSKLNICD